jgi:hypothetical protein
MRQWPSLSWRSKLAVCCEGAIGYGAIEAHDMGFLGRCALHSRWKLRRKTRKGDKVKMDTVAILGTGVSGLSFLMLLVGYQPTSKG